METDADGGMTESHAQSHRDAIEHWESGREHLVAEYGVEVVDDLIELQRMAFRLCQHKQSGLAVLISLISELWALSANDQTTMMLAVVRLKPLVTAVKVTTLAALAAKPAE
jgi:hypothetical protein